MRILYLGLPLGALFLARAGHRPAAVLTGHRGAPGTRRVRRQLGPRGTLLLARPDLGSAEVLRTLEALRPDLTLSFFWPRRIPAALLALCPAYGTHPSLLPRWRGPDPYFWSIFRGDRETGVTLHALTPGLDEGPILDRVPVAIGPRDTALGLARRLDAPALTLLVRCARDAAAGTLTPPEPQDEGQATWAPIPQDADLAIDWQRPAEEILRLVRAAAPWPGATALLGDTMVIVARASLASDTPPGGLRVAEAWLSAKGVAVRAREGAVLLEGVRTLEGHAIDPRALLGLSRGS